MTTAKQIIEFIENKFPDNLRMVWDSTDGLVQGDLNKEIKNVVLSLELRNNLVNLNKEMFIFHHPPIFGKDKTITNPYYNKVKDKNNIIYALHSRMDVAGFNNISLAKEIFGKDNLGEIKVLGDGSAVFELKNKITFQELTKILKEKLKLKSINLIKQKENIKKIAIHGGEGFNHHHIQDALKENIDTYLAGDLTHHLGEFAHFFPEVNFLDIGHFSEQVGMKHLAVILKEKFTDVNFEFIEQKPWWDTE